MSCCSLAKNMLFIHQLQTGIPSLQSFGVRGATEALVCAYSHLSVIVSKSFMIEACQQLLNSLLVIEKLVCEVLRFSCSRVGSEK